jgi:hypothetical protein
MDRGRRRRRRLLNTNHQEIKDTSQVADIVKFLKSLRLRWCGHVQMQNQRMPKQSGTVNAERGRSRDKVEENLNTMGIKKTGRQWLDTVGIGVRLYWEPRSTTNCRV